MTIQVTYIADDGEEFETEEECLDHERVMMTDGKALFFDSDCELIEGSVIDKVERAHYIYILDGETAKEFFEWADEYTGCPVPDEYETGALYFFDEREQHYKDLGKIITGLSNIGMNIMVQVEKVRSEGD